MENQKPIDVLPNEHIAQHRKTQAVLWEEVAHVVQAARDLAQNAIPAIRLGTDWKETDLFCKGIKQ